MINCVACLPHYVGMILSGFQYRFLSCRGDIDIDHDDGDL